jgi:hypothetical protein
MARYKKGSTENTLSTKVIKILAEELNLSEGQARRHYSGITGFSKSPLGRAIIEQIKKRYEQQGASE